MKYIARPFVIEAEESESGDYVVTEKKDGKDIRTVVPKHEFERKFQAAKDSPHGAA